MSFIKQERSIEESNDDNVISRGFTHNTYSEIYEEFVNVKQEEKVELFETEENMLIEEYLDTNLIEKCDYECSESEQNVTENCESRREINTLKNKNKTKSLTGTSENLRLISVHKLNIINELSAIKSVNDTEGNSYARNTRSKTKVAEEYVKNNTQRVFINVEKFNSLKEGKPRTEVKKDHKIFTCTFCDKILTTKQNYQVHLRTHTGEKPFICNICNKTFNVKGNLQTHMKIHTDDKSFTCNICTKTFITKQNLQNHKRIHTGEMLYTCGTCNKKFNTKQNLDNHMRIHSGEKPYICTMCGKAFRAKSNLITHAKIHGSRNDSEHTCGSCDKSFITKQNLENHIRTHTGEKPFICTLCGKAFNAKSNLLNHTKSHNNEKSHLCTVCNKSFSTKQSLYIHCRSHTQPPVSSAT